MHTCSDTTNYCGYYTMCNEINMFTYIIPQKPGIINVLLVNPINLSCKNWAFYVNILTHQIIENFSNARRIVRATLGMFRLFCRLLPVGRLFISTLILTWQIPPSLRTSLRSGMITSVSPVLGILEARVAISLNGSDSELKFLSYSLTSTSPFSTSIDSKEGTKKFLGHFTLTALPLLSSKESVSISTTLPLSNGTAEIYILQYVCDNMFLYILM